jgi:microcystin-dependent protein
MAQTALRRGSQEEGNSDYFTGCPIGGGFMWFGLPDKIPSNCMICDNTTLAIANFAKLHENLGGAWGVSGANLNIPDLRGRFPRGVDGGAAKDPDRASRTAANTGGNTGDVVGSVQDDATQSHAHVSGIYGLDGSYSVYGDASVAAGARFGTSSGSSVSPYTGGPVSDSTSSNIGGTPRASSESRPKNANVYFVIRVE